MTMPNRTIPRLPPGTRIREFELLRQISEGGQGNVYLARLWAADNPPIDELLAHVDQGITPDDVAAQQLCIIKVPHPASADNLRDEHAFLSDPAITHPRVVALFRTPEERTEPRRGLRPGLRFATLTASDGTQIAEHPCLVLQYEPGGSLRELMRQHNDGALPPGAAVLIVRQIAEALDHLHSVAGIVHHDISPANIVLRQRLPWDREAEPDCVVVDLAAADSTRYTRQREVLAKSRYRAPERKGGAARGAIATPPDIYSLGVVLYELLAGSASIRTEQVVDQPRVGVVLPPLRERQPDRSPEIAALVADMTAADPAARPSAAAVIARLDATPERSLPAGLRGPRPAAPAVAPTMPAPRRQGLRYALVAALAAALVAALLLMTGIGQPAATPTPTPAEPTVTAIPTATPLPTPTSLPPTSTPALGATRP